MTRHPEQFANFYDPQKLGFDLTVVEKGYQKFKKYFKGTTALELGPATGYMTRLLINDFEHLYIVEGSETLLEQIPAYTNVTKVNALFEDFTPAVKFDTIILNHVLEHIENPVSLLKLIGTWLSDDGVLIVGVPNSKSFHRLAAVKMGLLAKESDLNSRDVELGHYRVYDFSLLRDHINQAGLKIIEEGGIFIKFLSNTQIEKFLTKEIIDAYFELAEGFKENSAEIFVVLKK
jgi:2-polyprenyl-3-methyl-5-hydroxy-6-metoxy-1,4-benzoquinol methylase